MFFSELIEFAWTSPANRLRQGGKIELSLAGQPSALVSLGCSGKSA